MTYPQNKEEVAQFVNDIMRMIYSEGQPERILERITADENTAMALGQLAGTLVMTTLVRRQEQTGRKPHFNLLIRGLRKAIEEMADLMEMAGLQRPGTEVLQEAANYAGKVIESAMQGGDLQAGMQGGDLQAGMQGGDLQAGMQQPQTAPQQTGGPLQPQQGGMV